MKKYSAYIVDDEPLSIRSLRKKLEDFPEVEIIGEATRMPEAAKEIESLYPDILFLDIQLMEGSGFDLLNKIDYNGNVIFVTAYDEFAFRAFEVNALDYILKPTSHERLKIALEKVINKSGKTYDSNIKYRISDRILIVDRSKMRFILISTIEMITAARDYTTINTSDGGSYLILRSMKEWEDKLPPDHFIRIHRSYIVNINNIEKIKRTSTSSALIYLKNHTEPVSMSRTYYRNAKLKYI